MKKQTTRRALVLSALSLLLCVSMLIGTTFAWFTDSVTSGRNTIMSGNLDVKLEYSLLDPATGTWGTYNEVTESINVFGYNNWEPGYTAIAKFRVTNAGSLALKYQLSADVYEETAGVNVAGQSFLLSDYLFTEVVDVDATRDEILSSTTGKRFKQPVNGAVNTDLHFSAKSLESGEEEELAVAIWMPTTVGNEANHNGVSIPSIEFGINLIATQYTFENDSFGTDYDANATYPLVAWATAPVDAAAANYELPLLMANGGKVGSADVPKAAVAADAKNVSISIKQEDSVNASVVVAADQTGKTFDVKVEGLKENNDKELKIELNVGKNLTGVKLYHHGNEMDPSKYNYKADTGMLTFFSAEFSPFTIVYDVIEVEEVIENPNNEVPVAIVTDANEFENVAIDWTGWGGFNPYSANQQLDSVYLFQAPHTSETVADCIYKDWYCDYYVMVKTDNDLEYLPEGSITLGGNYGGYGWVGFDNPEVPTNTYISLLGSVMSGEIGTGVNEDWRYEDIVDFVQMFWCGVGIADANQTNLNGVEFIVELRLTNPDNYNDTIAVNTVTYNFGTGASNISSYQG